MGEKDGQELVTKPFKFVTGMSQESLPKNWFDGNPRLTTLQPVSSRPTKNSSATLANYPIALQ